jgi:hypothetical protein
VRGTQASTTALLLLLLALAAVTALAAADSRFDDAAAAVVPGTTTTGGASRALLQPRRQGEDDGGMMVQQPQRRPSAPRCQPVTLGGRRPAKACKRGTMLRCCAAGANGPQACRAYNPNENFRNTGCRYLFATYCCKA